MVVCSTARTMIKTPPPPDRAEARPRARIHRFRGCPSIRYAELADFHHARKIGYTAFKLSHENQTEAHPLRGNLGNQTLKFLLTFLPTVTNVYLLMPQLPTSGLCPPKLWGLLAKTAKERIAETPEIHCFGRL